MDRISIVLLIPAMVVVLGACHRSPQASETTREPAKAPVVKLTETERALLIASFRGDKAMVKDLLDAGANVNVKDEAGRTPLTEAAWNGHTETIKLLLERGADPNIKKNDGQTALSLALARGQKDAVEVLKNAKTK